MKKLTAATLAVLMLLSALSVTAFAANGPSKEKWGDDYYLAYISFYNYNVENANYGIFKNNAADNKAIAGATYDVKTNTLTLKNFKHPELFLETNMMGDDFKINVTGTCETGAISVWGDGYGGSVEFIGSGTLTVNKSTQADYGVAMHPEGCEVNLNFGKSVKLNLYGAKSAAAIIGVDGSSHSTGFAFADGKSHSIAAESMYSAQFKYVTGYYFANPKENSISHLGHKAVKKDNPDTVYAASEHDGEYTVKKIVYNKKHKFNLIDYSFEALTLTPEQFAAQGFEIISEDKTSEYPEYIEAANTARHIHCTEYTDENGKKYYKHSGGYIIDEITDAVMEATPLTEIENEYEFTISSDSVSFDDLTETGNAVNGYYFQNGVVDNVGQKAICKSDPDGLYTYSYWTMHDTDNTVIDDGYDVVKHIYLADRDVYLADTSFGDYSSYYGCSFYGTKTLTAEEWENSDFEPYYPVTHEPVEITNPFYEKSVSYEMPVFEDKNGKEYCVITDYSDSVQKKVVLDMEKIDELENAYWLTENKTVSADDLTETISKKDTGLKNYFLQSTKLEYSGNGSTPVDVIISGFGSSKVSGIKDKVYTGKALTQSVTVKLNGKTLKNGTDYTVSYKNNTNAGKATVILKGKGKYSGTITKTFKILKAANTMSISYKKSAAAKANATVKSAVVVKKAKGTVSYKTNNKKFTVKSGNLKIAKGTKKGKYTVKVTITAKGSSNYNKASKSVSIKVTVK